MDEKFEKLIRGKCDKVSNQSFIAFIIALGLSVYLFYLGIKFSFVLFFVLGIAFLLVLFYILKKRKGDFNGGDFWITMIKENPDNIVWIKPIATKHKIGLVFTLFETREFQFFTKDREAVII